MNAEQRQRIHIQAEEAWQTSTMQLILAAESRRQFTHFEEEYKPRIAALTREADELAARFRELYREADNEYSFGSRAAAKQKKEEGYGAETRCKVLNREANALRRILEETYADWQTKEYEHRRWMQKARDYERKLWTKRRNTSVMGFDESVIDGDFNVKKFLDTFPQGIFNKIEFIEYDDKPEEDGSLGYVTKNLMDTGKFIRIFPNPSKSEFKRTMASMIGGVVYDEFMDDESRRLWGVMHERMLKEHRIVSRYTAGTAEGNFRECFALYKTKPHWLEQFDEKAYHFIKIIYNFLPDEENENP